MTLSKHLLNPLLHSLYSDLEPFPIPTLLIKGLQPVRDILESSQPCTKLDFGLLLGRTCRQLRIEVLPVRAGLHGELDNIHYLDC
jgi:hypothetical protein